ncbi:YciI family protein [Crossiella sp. CA198]|uniref:YciI family protein n=1 Tax=Crossiella sp. CA198 TaxID=3455607 RepID=UPI003F8D48F6
MKYLLMVCAETAADTPEFAAWLREVDDRGASRTGLPLAGPAEAVTVRVRGTERRLAEGPFGEINPWSVEIIDCADLDTAVAIAAAHPAAGRGPIEVRAYWED